MTFFQEPVPRQITPPEKEPSLRVGIVLEEDARKTLSLTLKSADYLLEDAGITFPAGTTLQIRVAEVTGKDEIVEISSHAGSVYRSSCLRLIPVTPAPPEETKGVEIAPMRVGRGFHWSKDTTLIFPGTLEFIAHKGCLVAINELPFESYLTCVACSEMGAECPDAFMRAQAICARAWAYVFLGNKHPGKPYQICNDDDCQRYQGTTFLNSRLQKAAEKDKGVFLITENSHVLPSYYAKCCGGHSDLPQEIFGFTVEGISAVSDSKESFDGTLSEEDGFSRWLAGKAPQGFCSSSYLPQDSLSRYLGAVDISRDYYRWNHEIAEGEIAKNLREKFSIKDAREVLSLIPKRRSISGRITSLEIRYRGKEGERSFLLPSQYEIRRALHESFLLSSAFLVNKQGNNFSFQGAGWGHGIGLCQMGGVGMALAGKSTEEILRHYFPLATLMRAY